MNYLATTDYLTYGLDATTDPSWITAASAIIDAHCRRATLGVNQYEERLKMPPELNTVRVSYLPLVTVAPATTPIVTLQGRYGIPRRGEWPFPEMSLEFALVFSLPGMWTTIDPTTIDIWDGQRRADVSGECAGIVLQRSGCGLQRGMEHDPDAGAGGVRADREECAGDAGAECAIEPDQPDAAAIFRADAGGRHGAEFAVAVCGDKGRVRKTDGGGWQSAVIGLGNRDRRTDWIVGTEGLWEAEFVGRRWCARRMRC